MAKRNRKGQFIKGGRGRRRGMGTIITVKRGMGALPGGALGEAIIAPAAGGLVTAIVALAIRRMVLPGTSATNGTLVRYAPLFGGLAGAVMSLVLLMLGGRNAAIAGFVSTLGVTLGLYGQDMILASPGTATANGGANILAALQPPSSAAIAGYRRRGAGAIVPEYSRNGARGMGALVMEPVGPNGRRAGTLGRNMDRGETVNLGGLNVGAFGTPSFRA